MSGTPIANGKPGSSAKGNGRPLAPFDVWHELRMAQAGAWVQTDWMGDVNSFHNELNWVFSASGSTETELVDPPAPHKGVIRMSVTTAADARFLWRSALEQIAPSGFGSGRIAFLITFRFDVAPAATDPYYFYAGICSQEATVGEPLDGVYLYLDDTLGSFLEFRAANAGTRTTLASTLTPTADTWYTAAFLINEAGDAVDCFLKAGDGGDFTHVGRISSNVQPADGVHPSFGLRRDAVTRTTQIELDVDLTGWGYERQNLI